jgi:ABC-type lipoprotein release transport system permease subunit
VLLPRERAEILGIKNNDYLELVVVASTYNPSYIGGRSRRTKVRGLYKQKHENLPKNQTKNKKKPGSVAQVTKYLQV